MKKFRVAPEAARDITEIFDYIAADSVDAAERVRDEIFAALQNLARMPGMGHKREDLTSRRVLFWPVSSYLILYNPGTNPFEIVAVLHGHRDVKNVLRRR